MSTFMGAAAAASIPPDVVEKTKHMILDTLAAMISGSELLPGRFAINFARAYKGDCVATVAGRNFLCGCGCTRNGVTSALLVQAGGTGVEDILSGADNFFAAFLPKNDPAMVIEKLGERYEISRTNIKKWTVGSPIQAPLDAIEILIKRHRFQPDQVKQIVVRAATNEAKIVNNCEIPHICLQHMIAVMLIDKTASFKSAHDLARMKDPEILKQRAKVQLVGDEELEKLMPRRVGIVEVTLNDGMRFSERVDNVGGTMENPMSREEVIAKARDLITPVVGAGTSEKLIDRVFDIENVKSVLELRPLQG